MTSIIELISGMDDHTTKCLDVNNFNTSWDKCNFTIYTEECGYDGMIYDFTHLVYCDIGDHYRAASICILFAIILFFFLAMGIVADEFLCPALLTISKTLRLPDNIAGVTFLAFGNGAPDIFSSISGVSQDKPDLIFGSLFGAGIFVTTVVAGSVLLSGQFEVIQRPLMRDIAFYIGASFMVWFIIWKTRIYLKNAIALVVVYVCYIAVVIIGRYFYMKIRKDKPVDDSIEEASESTEVSVISDGKDPESFGNHIDFTRTKTLTTKRQRSRTLTDPQDVVLTRFYRKGNLHTPRHSRTSSMIRKMSHHHHDNMLAVIQRNFDQQHNNPEKDLDYFGDDNEKPAKQKKITFLTQMSTISNASIFSTLSMDQMLTEGKEFLIQISPVDIAEWPEYPWYRKILEVFKAIPYFVMTLCIPVVDLESPKQNWCRLLTCINVILAPQVGLLFLGLSDNVIGHNFPVPALVFLISLPISVVIYLTTDYEKPPCYNYVFAFIGFGVSVLFINGIADEVINILKTLGIMFSLSDSILGLTILAWGNSLGDMIADLSMARHGYPSIGISACFGGPLLNLLLGLGLPYTILLVDEKEDGIELVYNRMVTLLYTTISISLVSSLVLFICNRFKSKKFHGIYLICIYFVYFVFAILIEYNIL